MSLSENIYRAAFPLLEGRTVTDLVVGISLMAVELDHKDIAVGYVLRDDLAGGCSIFPYACKAVGMPAAEAARWFVEGGDDVQRAIGGTVINAASRALPLTDSGSREKPFDLELCPGERVGMVGMIRPVAMQLNKRGCDMVVFDKGKCAHGNPADHIYPMERQAELLPTCSAVFLSGTTTVNRTIEPLMNMCSKDADVVLVGSSVPMIPEGYTGTPVSILAGSWWDHKDKAEIFRLISQAAGMAVLGQYMIKKNVRIK